MNITPIGRTLPVQFLWLPAGRPCVHHYWRQCNHVRAAPSTPLTGVQDVTSSRSDGMSDGYFGLRVRPARLKSP